MSSMMVVSKDEGCRDEKKNLTLKTTKKINMSDKILNYFI